MNYLRLVHIAILLVCLAQGVLIFLNNPRRLVNQCFLILTANLSIWLTFMMLAFQGASAAEVAGYVRATNAVAIFLPYFFDCLRHAIVEPHRRLLQVLWAKPYRVTACVLMAAMCQTTFFLRDVVMPADPAIDIAEPVYGPGIALYGVFFMGTFFMTVFLYFRAAAIAQGIKKTELQFVILAWAAGTVVGVLFSIVLPVVVGAAQTVQLLPAVAFVILTTIAYGIATRRIMDVPHVLRRVTAYGLLALYLSALYSAVWILSLVVARDVFHSHLPIPHLLATVVVAMSVMPAHGRLQHFANRLFVSMQTLDVASTVQKADRLFASISTLDELLDQFASIVMQSAGTDRMTLLLTRGGVHVQQYPKTTGFPAPLILEASDPVVQQLQREREPIVSDVLYRVRPSPVITEVSHRMAALHASLALGIYSKTGLEGVILLGPRLSGRIYGAAEQTALEILSNHLAVALENASLYTQVQDSMIYNNILLDNLVSGVIAASTERVITVFNREAQRITGLQGNQVIGQPIDILPPPFAHALAATLETGVGTRDAESHISSASGDDLPVRFSGSLFHSHTGKTMGALLVFNDLTLIRKLEQQVRRTDRLASLGTLSAGMAHEIKNPLVTLKTFTQLLPERYEDPDFRETFANLVGQEVRRIDSLVNQLLRFARPVKPSLLPMRIHEVLDNTLRLVQQQLRQRNVVLTRQYSAATDDIRGDSDLLVQAFLNFFLNAIDAMDEGGELKVVTEVVEQQTNQFNLWGQRVVEPYLRISVADTGKGIGHEDLPHIFDPFFTTKTTGTGLGLSVSHGIIHDHGGLIDVESEPRKGTTFRILFPLLRKEVTA
jgi:PAS domain S-box-containing protein